MKVRPGHCLRREVWLLTAALLVGGCMTQQPARVIDRSFEKSAAKKPRLPEVTKEDRSDAARAASMPRPPVAEAARPETSRTHDQMDSGRLQISEGVPAGDAVTQVDDVPPVVTPLPSVPEPEVREIPLTDIPTFSAPLASKIPYSDEAYLLQGGQDGKYPAPVLWAGIAWVWPTNGEVVNAFGSLKDAKGIEISGKIDQPVFAAADGKVVYVGAGLPGYGKLIIIRHNPSYISVYGNNHQINVKEGQQVQAGERISTIGKAPDGQGKLIFEIRNNGKPVNPENFMASSR